MASGTRQGAHGSTKRNPLPRIGSIEGIEERMAIRAAHVPSTSDKFRGGFRKPGSRNRRKVGRG